MLHMSMGYSAGGHGGWGARSMVRTSRATSGTTGEQSRIPASSLRSAGDRRCAAARCTWTANPGAPLANPRQHQHTQPPFAGGTLQRPPACPQQRRACSLQPRSRTAPVGPAPTVWQAQDDLWGAVEAGHQVGRDLIVAAEHGRPKVAQLDHGAPVVDAERGDGGSVGWGGVGVGVNACAPETEKVPGSRKVQMAWQGRLQCPASKT